MRGQEHLNSSHPEKTPPIHRSSNLQTSPAASTDPEGSRQIFVIDSTSIGFSCSESPPISTLCETHPAKPGPGFLGSSPNRLEPTFLNGNPGLRNAFLSYLGDAAFLLQ